MSKKKDGKKSTVRLLVYAVIIIILLITLYILVPKNFGTHTSIISSPQKSGIQTTFPSYVKEKSGKCIGSVVSVNEEFEYMGYRFRTEGTKCKGLIINQAGSVAV